MRSLALWLGCCALIVAWCSSAPAGPAKDPLAVHYTGAGSGAAIVPTAVANASSRRRSTRLSSAEIQEIEDAEYGPAR